MIITCSVCASIYTDAKYLMSRNIAQIAPLSFQAAIPHEPRQVRWGELHASVVTDHQHVCISNSQEAITQATKENLTCSQLTQYWSYKPHLNFKPTWNFSRFCMCPSNDASDKHKKFWCRYWGSTAKTGRDKANISNPKVNRGRAPVTANRISADCGQISLGPSIPYIPLGVYHTGGRQRYVLLKKYLCWYRIF